MSFPFHDKYWCDVAEFVELHRRPDETILANDLFWWRFSDIYRYANLHLNPRFQYDWVVVHKGELQHFPILFLEHLQQRYTAVLANPVFVVWAIKAQTPALENHPDVLSFQGLLDIRKQQDFLPQSADDDVTPTPGRITSFQNLSKTELADAMDRFFRRGGYEYRTKRDATFYKEIDRWLDVYSEDLENASILDIACGNGRVARSMKRYRSIREIDLSPVAIELAKQDGAHDTRRKALVMDAEALDFPEASFDAATFVEAIEHVHDVGAVLQETSRVLKSGGVLILNSANANSLHQRMNAKLGYPYFKTNYQHLRELTWQEVQAALDSAGFDIERAEGIFLYPYWGIPGVDEHVRSINDDDPEIVEAMRFLGERAGPEYAYCSMIRARKR